MKHCDRTVCRDLCKGHQLMKREARGGEFDTVATNSQTDVKSFHAGRGLEGHLPR